MTTAPQSMPAQLDVKLDHVLESAVALNWKDLVQGQSDGLVQIEYHVGGRSVRGLPEDVVLHPARLFQLDLQLLRESWLVKRPVLQ